MCLFGLLSVEATATDMSGNIGQSTDDLLVIDPTKSVCRS